MFGRGVNLQNHSVKVRFLPPYHCWVRFLHSLLDDFDWK